jgi:uncharacterized protein (TIGR00251 family)
LIPGPDACWRWQGEDLLLDVRAQPRAGRNEIAAADGGRLRVRVTAAPADGKANAAIIRLLAGYLALAPSRIELVAGHKGRDKRFRIRGPLRLPEPLAIAGSEENEL